MVQELYVSAGNAFASYEVVEVLGYGEEVLVPPRSQQDVPVKMLYGNLTSSAQAWMTEARELQPGVYLARVVIDNSTDVTHVRVVNLNEAVQLTTSQLLGGLHPVEVGFQEEDQAELMANDKSSSIKELIADLSKKVPVNTKKQLKTLLEEYKDILSVTESDLGRTSTSAHRIDTADANPVRQPLRRQPLPHNKIVDEQLARMLRDGLIEPAVSEWAANVVLARKKDGSLRFCIDYRHPK